MAVEADLGFASGEGYIRTQRRFSRPKAKVDTRDEYRRVSLPRR